MKHFEILKDDSKYFELLKDNFKYKESKQVFRIIATKEGPWGPIGTIGGFVETLDNLNDKAWLYDNAIACEDARLYDNAIMRNHSVVSGNARLYDDSSVINSARVTDNAELYDSCIVSNYARVGKNTALRSYCYIGGSSTMMGGEWYHSPLQITGSRHHVNIASLEELAIGCKVLSFKEWKREFKIIGKHELYTPNEIKEYGLYIDIATKLAKQYKILASITK